MCCVVIKYGCISNLLTKLVSYFKKSLKWPYLKKKVLSHENVYSPSNNPQTQPSVITFHRTFRNHKLSYFAHTFQPWNGIFRPQIWRIHSICPLLSSAPKALPQSTPLNWYSAKSCISPKFQPGWFHDSPTIITSVPGMANRGAAFDEIGNDVWSSGFWNGIVIAPAIARLLLASVVSESGVMCDCEDLHKNQSRWPLREWDF